jgi:signal peptidase II
MKALRSGWWWLWLTFVVVILDRVTKLMALNYLSEYQAYSVVPSLDFILAYNKGAAFSFLNSAAGWQIWFFGVLAASVSIGIVIWLRRLAPQQYLLCIGLSLVLGGALGNLCDRIYHGYVIDFIDVYISVYHWPVFNIADSAICLGAGLLFWDSLRK